MVKLKKYRVSKEICDVCNGNGYVTIHGPKLKKIHQCWECDSEGEYYVYTSTNLVSDSTDDNNDKLLH